MSHSILPDMRTANMENPLPLLRQSAHMLSIAMHSLSFLRSRRTQYGHYSSCFCALYRPGRSIYALTRQEITRGIANRFVHSRIYILLYLAMAALSITTVVLSLKDGCPTLAFYILEVIINTAMIAEVVVRFLALGSVRITLNINPGLLQNADGCVAARLLD